MESSDWELVQRAQNGEADAFATLYTRYSQYLFNFALRQVKPDWMLAEDITSEVFTRAYQKIHQFSPMERGSFRAWLICIARHLIADHFRRSETRMSVLCDVRQWEGLVTITASSDTPEATIMMRAWTDELRREISRLPEKQRACIVLRFFEDLPFREVALKIGTSEGAARVRNNAAIHSLRRRVQR